MLILSRKLGERIYIGDDISIVVVDIDRGKVRIGIKAPKGVLVLREELRTVAQSDQRGLTVPGQTHPTQTPPTPKEATNAAAANPPATTIRNSSAAPTKDRPSAGQTGDEWDGTIPAR